MSEPINIKKITTTNQYAPTHAVQVAEYDVATEEGRRGAQAIESQSASLQ